MVATVSTIFTFASLFRETGSAVLTHLNGNPDDAPIRELQDSNREQEQNMFKDLRLFEDLMILKKLEVPFQFLCYVPCRNSASYQF